MLRARSAQRWLCAANHRRLYASRAAAATGGDKRDVMRDYWSAHSDSGSIEEMMLDNNAGLIEEQERKEILSLLPDFRGKRVVELAAGIGRFTGTLCESAAKVTAVDFVDKFSQINFKNNGHHGNLTCVSEDVTRMELAPSSQDLIFSNWLLMYLSDAEVEAFAHKALRWLSPGGRLFFRESCYRQSGNVARGFNPTNYRDPEEYTFIFKAATQPRGDAASISPYGFVLEQTKRVETYVEQKGNEGQICWLWKKAVVHG